MSLYLALAISVFAALIAVVSLVFHWIRGREHPDVTTLRAEVMDLLDRVEHWMKRDRVRRLRESHEEPESQPPPGPPSSADLPAYKAALRAKVFGRR